MKASALQSIDLGTISSSKRVKN